MSIRLHALVCLLALLFFSAIHVGSAADKVHVLLLNSYHAGMDWTDGETTGVREVLKHDGRDVLLHIEYMDTKRLADATHFENLRQLLAYKYRNIRLAAIIATDNDAFNFLQRYRDGLFGDVPVIFTGVNFFRDKMLDGLHGYTGVAETFEGGQTIAMMQKLHPNVRRIVVIIDATTTGMAIRKELEPMLAPFAGQLTFEFWDTLSLEQLRERLPKLGSDTLVLLMPYARDSADTYVTYAEMADRVSRAAPVPVYGTWDFYMGYGIVGGKLTNAAAQGRAAAQILLRVLSGTAIEKIPVTRVAPSEFQFDARQLHRHGIAQSELPSGSRMLFLSWFESNRARVWLGGVLVVIALLLASAWWHSYLLRRRSEIARIESEANYRELVENVNAIVLRMGLDGSITYFNEVAERFFGYKAAEILGRHVVGTIVPAQESETGRDLSTLITSILADPACYEHNENENMTRDGRRVFIRWANRVILDQMGKPTGVLSIGRDVTDLKKNEEALRDSEDRFRTIANYTYDWEYWESPQREMLFISPSCERITGYLATDFISDRDLLQRIVHPEDRETWQEHFCSIKDAPYGELSFRIVRKDGQIRWIAHGCQAVYSRNGQFRGRRSSNRDITDLKQAEQLAHQLAYFDSLTNLPNRRMLMDRMRNALTQAKRFHRSLAVMFLDLDRFKQTNDTLGHDIGDKLLVGVAGRLSRCVRQGDTVSRTGGDEFIILLPEISHPNDARTVAEKIIQGISAPIRIDEHFIETSASIGIAIYPVDGADDTEELMKKADLAMYEAKQAGRNRYRVFDA